MQTKTYNQAMLAVSAVATTFCLAELLSTGSLLWLLALSVNFLAVVVRLRILRELP